ncbi:major facilitator superfamily domain-containing protein [Aspergillus cavernicola]|uniref:Major facilitator superfamily domain-containing protein n=1 Tax=Aspergillus cavernicola TaxID=176166 RepID=A0ABR4J1B2_9EURO
MKTEVYPLTDIQKGIVGWESQTDPLNPRNYSPSRKWFLLFLVSMITFISPFASSVFAPAVADADLEFGNTSSVLGTLGVTSYLFGYGTGPLILSPLSEIHGRRIVLNAATSFFVLFQIGCALAPNLSALIVFRVLTGIGGSACLTIGGGVVSDLFEPEERGLAMSIFSAGPLLGPVLGPICGGFIAQGAGWRWVFWVLVIVGGTFTTFVAIFNRETNPVILLRSKTERLRKELSRPDLRSCYEKENRSEDSSITRLILGLATPLRLLFRAPIVSIIAVYIATIYGCLYLLFTTVTSVFQDIYGWSVAISGLAYIGLGLGFLTSQFIFGMASDRIIIRLKARNGGVFEPEMRLPISIFFASFVPISFFWYGWSAQAHTHWIVPIIGLFPFAFGMMGIFGTLQTYIVDSYPQYAASGFAAITVTRSLFGALLPLAGPYMYHSLGYGWGDSLLGFVTLGMIPIPLLLSHFGAFLRERAAFV